MKLIWKAETLFLSSNKTTRQTAFRYWVQSIRNVCGSINFDRWVLHRFVSDKIIFLEETKISFSFSSCLASNVFCDVTQKVSLVSSSGPGHIIGQSCWQTENKQPVFGQRNYPKRLCMGSLINVNLGTTQCATTWRIGGILMSLLSFGHVEKIKWHSIFALQIKLTGQFFHKKCTYR